MARIGTVAPGSGDQGWACGCPSCLAASGAGEAGGGASGPYTSGDPDDAGNAAAILSSSGGWSDHTLTFSFAASVPSYYKLSAAERLGFTPMTEAQKTAVRAALEEISRVTDLHFVEDKVASDGPGDLVFGATRLPDGVGAWGYLPQTSLVGGDVWISTEFRNNAAPEPGSAGFARLMHEIGHALGLKHSGNYDSTGKDVDGPFLPPALDNRQYTIMAYDPHPAYEDTRPSTPMPFDIVALQGLYGANRETGLGDTVYQWQPAKPVIAAVWDAGGHDRFDASNHLQAVTLDLREGHYSSVGVTDDGAPGRDNVAVAFGTTIEDATGGAGADRLIGNDVANRIDGGAGDDRIAGGLGADTILGGAGNDVAEFDGDARDYHLSWDDDWLLVSGPDGQDRLQGIERLQFDDGAIATPAVPVAAKPLPAAEAPPPHLRFDDVVVTEGNSGKKTVAVTVRLDHASDEAVEVDWLTWGITAKKGQDYVGDEGTLVIAPGRTEATIALRILGDRTREGDEVVELRFSDPHGANFAGDDRAAVTIRNDDGGLLGFLGDGSDRTMPAGLADWLF